MTRIQLISLGFVLLASACGELSRTPGVEDAGTGSLRTTCEKCVQGVEKCEAAECFWTCDTSLLCPPLRPNCVTGLCRPLDQESCDELHCNGNQRCANGTCVGDSDVECSAPSDPACARPGACERSVGRCYVPAPCGAERGCLVGAAGAVCNVDRQGTFPLDLQAPRWTCLIGRCTRNDHCPAPLTCQDIGADIEGLGVCR